MYNLLIEKNNNITTIAVIQDYELVEIYQEKEEEKRLEGNIYLGKVKNTIKGMQSAFIDIGENKNALIHIKDVIQKVSNITGNNLEDTSKYDIGKLLKQKDNILVQIKRDCNEQKGPRVTKDIKLNGKFVILMPYSKFITISQKIESKEEKNRLIQIVNNILPKEYGMIIRTASENKNKEEIEEEVKKLIELWNVILEKAKQSEKQAPIKVYDNHGIIGKIVTDLSENNLEKIYTNIINLNKEYPELEDKIEITDNVLDKFDVKNKMEIKRKIWLKCGGFITIDNTEALTAIDVNSGKFTGNKNLENTVLKVNKEATKEIVKQIRLRDIGGIIVIDYIDMDNEKDKEEIRNYIIEELKNDRSKVQVMEFTKLGLLEITRKHIFGRR